MKKKRAKRRTAPASDSPEAACADRTQLASRFVRFADEARAHAGPLYAELATRIARDDELLDLAGRVRRPPVPNVLFAAVHFLLAENRSHDLAAFYGSLTDTPRPAGEAYDAFRDFVQSNRAALIPLLETRITQTNEVSRCSSLLPALTAVHRSAGGRPLALIDVGCSAGLHLRWDRYHYDYGVVQVGNVRSIVRIVCELRGPVMPPLPERFPECRFRIGIDLNPVDLTNSIERRWFDALIWPEHAARRTLAAAAIEELLRDPPAIVRSDARDALEAEIRKVPSGTSLVVYNSAALCQGGAVEETAIAQILGACTSHRPIYWLHCENEEVLLRVMDGGCRTQTKLANRDGHGRWLEWLQVG